MKIGINPGLIQYYSSDLSFKDLRKSGAYFFTSNSTTPDTGSDFIPGDGKTDLSGNPTSFSTLGGDFARTNLVKGLPGSGSYAPYPSGTYHVLYEGTGTIEIDGDGDWAGRTQVGTGHISFYVANPTTAGLILKITETDPGNSGDYVRNLRIVHNDDLASYETQPYNDRLLNQLKELSDEGPFRAMNWNYINGEALIGRQTYNDYWVSANTNWEDRVPSGAIQGAIGASVEGAVDVCNRIDRDLWYAVPHRATRAYTSSVAEYIRDNLDSDKHVYVEWSNEFWNGGFFQFNYCYSGAAHPDVSAQYYGGLTIAGTNPPEPDYPRGGGSGNDARAAKSFGADQAASAFTIFYEVFGESAPTRISRVLGTQAFGPWQTERMLEWSGIGGLAPSSITDVLGIAPYFGADYGRAPIADEILTLSATNTDQQLIDILLASASFDVSAPTGRTRTNVELQKAIADKIGAELHCYEGGQHFAPIGSYKDTLTDLMIACNYDPKMGTRYTEWLNMLKTAGVAVTVMYRAMSIFSRFGSFGLEEYYNQTPRPKYDATVAFIGAKAVSTFYQNNLGYRLDINS